MKKMLRRLLPERLILFYHYVVTMGAAAYYGFPSRKMVVIGVTGTKGKTSTSNFIWSCLMSGGYKTGIVSTANIRIGDKEFLNKYHMTMPGRATIQRLMAQMVKEGCTHCVVETTSEGIKQHRNAGIWYDVAVFTNLTPEHLQSHGGSFEAYKAMKGKLFASLSRHHKKLQGKPVEKVIIANADSQHAAYYLNFPADKKLTFSLREVSDYRAEGVAENGGGVTFAVSGMPFSIGILGKFNVYNALPAIAVARLFGVSDERINKGFANLTIIPGRMELIDEGQDFTVIVDYAHEKQSITYVLETAKAMKPSGAKTIILLGAEGGGRDKAKRPIMGELAAKMAEVLVVANVDPYDDDPKEILEDIATSAEAHGMKRDQNMFVIQDRREGIHKALSLAGKGDVVLITGKGAEQSMVVGAQKIPWDDRTVVREELKALK